MMIKKYDAQLFPSMHERAKSIVLFRRAADRVMMPRNANTRCRPLNSGHCALTLLIGLTKFSASRVAALRIPAI